MTLAQCLKRPFCIPFLILSAIILTADYYHQPTWENIGAEFVARVSAVKKGQDRSWLTVNDLVVIGGARPLAGPALLTVLDPQQQLVVKAGDRIQFRTHLKQAVGYANPGVFDYARYLGRQGIVAKGFVPDPQGIKWITAARPVAPIAWKSGFKDRVKRALNDLTLDGSTTSREVSILVALLWGEKTADLEEGQLLFRNQGLAHLLVISGVHFVCLAWFVYQLCLVPGRMYTVWLIQLPYRRVACILTGAVMTGYFWFCEPAPSLLRAYIAISLYLIAQVIYRRRDWLNILFCAGFVILLIQPADLFNVSFQLSFGAVLALILVHPILYRTVSRLASGSIMDWFSNLLAGSAATFLVLTPMLLYYFQEFQWGGLWNNLWAVPLTGYLFLPLSLLGLIGFGIHPPLGVLIFKIDLVLLNYLLELLQWLDGGVRPVAFFPPHGWELFFYYGLLLVLFFKIPRSKKLFLATCCGFGLVLCPAISIWENSFPPELRITHLDVGQGDAILVEMPGPKRLLIDTGGSPFFDTGRQVLLPYLRYRRLDSLDVLCLTHADGDHFRGAASLIASIPIREVWWNGKSTADPDFMALLSLIRSQGIRLRSPQAGDEWSLGPGTGVRILSPFATGESRYDNNNSLSLLFTTPHHRALFTGDIEKLQEARLVSHWGEQLRADYLKIPHHGSLTSSSAEFLDAVAPRWASVSTGVGNRFGHPHPRVIKHYSERGIEVLRTDRDGMITIEMGPDRIITKVFGR